MKDELGTVEQWLAVQPPSKVAGLIPSLGPFCADLLLCFMFSHCLCGFAPGFTVPNTIQKHVCEVNWKL